MTQARLTRLLEKYYDAEEAVLMGKSVMMNGQSMTLENLSEIRRGRQKSKAGWPSWVAVAPVHVIHWRGFDECTG